MKLHIISILFILLIGFSYAICANLSGSNTSWVNLSYGECATFENEWNNTITLFAPAPPNISLFLIANSTKIDSWGAVSCIYSDLSNLPNTTLWANATNGSFTCLSNSTTLIFNQTTIQNITNITNCTFQFLNLSFIPSDSPQDYANTSANWSVHIDPIPFSYCLENRIENASEFKIWSDRCNNTFVCVPQAQSCPLCPQIPSGRSDVPIGGCNIIGSSSFCCANQTIIVKEFVPFTAELQNVSCEQGGCVLVRLKNYTIATLDEARALQAGDGDAWLANRTASLQETIKSNSESLKNYHDRIYGTMGYEKQLLNVNQSLTTYKQDGIGTAQFIIWIIVLGLITAVAVSWGIKKIYQGGAYSPAIPKKDGFQVSDIGKLAKAKTEEFLKRQ